MISVLLPVCDGERFLAEAIESVLGQTWPGFELLVLDDGSTDATPRIARSFADRDDRVRHVRLAAGGLSRALNAGLAQARYPHIARLDADDIAYPHRLATQLRAAMRHPEVALWGAHADGIDERGRRISLVAAGPSTPAGFERLRRKGKPIQILHPTAFFSREVAIRAGGYDPRFDGIEDLDLWNRMAAFGQVRVLPEPLISYRVHADSAGSRRFYEVRALVREIESRIRRDAGSEVREGAAVRFGRRLDDHSRWLYRRAGIAFAGRRHVRASTLTLAAGVLNPLYVLPRLWRQLGPARPTAISRRAS